MKRLLILLFFCRLWSVDLYSQSWPLELFPGQPDWTTSVIESYDKGFIFASVNYVTNSYKPIQGKLFKTDVNGELLWQKYVVDHDSHITLTDVVENSEGEIFLGGITDYRDPFGDVFLLKMDPCLNVLWCKILRTNMVYDDIEKIQATSDGGCIALLPVFDNINQHREWLFRYDASGNLLWKSYYIPDSLMASDNCHALIPSPDSSYLMYGFSYLKDSINGAYLQLRTLYMKVDLDGNLKWYRNFDHENGLFFDCGNNGKYTCLVDSSGNIFSNLVWRIDPHPSILFLAKFSESGEPIHRYPYTDTTFFNSYTDPLGILLLNNNLFAMTYGGSKEKSLMKTCVTSDEVPHIQYRPRDYNPGNSIDELQSYSFIQLVDSLGDTLKKKPFPFSYTSPLLKSHDGKIVLACTDGDFMTQLYKFNSNLDFDSVYTVHGPYNYKCSDDLNLDTFTLDGEIYTVGVSDVYATTPSQLSVFPNPVDNQLHVKLPDFCKTVTKYGSIEYIRMASSFGPGYILEIVDLFGRSISSFPVAEGQKEYIINAGSLPSGMYLLRLKDGDNMIDNTKFIKQ